MHTQPVTLGRPLQTLAAGGFLVLEVSYTPSLALPRHGHDEAALCFAFRGAFDESVDGRTYECGAYDVMVRPPQVRHSNRYDAKGGARCVLVGVTPECLQRLAPHTSLFEAPHIVAREAGQPLAMRIHRELMAHDASSAIAMEGLVLELIGESSRPRRGTPPRWLHDARDYIHANWSARPSLADIARAGGVHPASLVRGFRAHLRCSPGEYLRRVRLEHARDALMTTQRSIADISLEAGFYDQSHFTNAFRRHFGITPAQLRSS